MSGPSWTDVNPELVRIFGELALRDEGSRQPGNWKPEWRDRAVVATAVSGQLKGVKLYLKVTSCIGIGTDEIRYEQETPTSYLQETIYGLRRVTLRLECHSGEASDEQWPLSILERIRSRLRRRRTIGALLALNVGIISIGAANDISSRKDQHIQSRAVMDLLLTMVSDDRDPVPTGWIASVVITSHLEDVDGIELPIPPNYTDTITVP